MSNMFDEILKQVKKVVIGLEKGVTACAESMPLLVRQEINIRANQKLDSTRNEYMNAIKSEYQGTVYIVDIDRDNWLAYSVENGVNPFSMKPGMLNSQKARTSKEGYKYLRVPIPQTKTGKISGTQEGQRLQAKIREALNRPKFATQKIKANADGTLSVSERVVTNDPEVQGLYRIRRFSSREAFKAGEQTKSTQFILFRTVSERPDAKGQWEHPGIRPARILPDVQQWCDSVLPQILSNIIDQAVENELKSD